MEGNNDGEKEIQCRSDRWDPLMGPGKENIELKDKSFTGIRVRIDEVQDNITPVTTAESEGDFWNWNSGVLTNTIHCNCLRLWLTKLHNALATNYY